MIASGGGAGVKRLAKNLSYPNDISGNQYVTVNGIDASGGLTEILGLTGKFDIALLKLTGLPTTENVTVKMTVDGEIIWNSTFTPISANLHLLGMVAAYAESYQCVSSLSLEVQTVTDNSINLLYNVRPVL